MNMQAMIFAAGLGTRLKDETQIKPKAMVEVGNKPLLQHAIEKLAAAGATKLVVNVHHFSELIFSFIKENDFGIPIHISDESEKLLDTGGGLKQAASFFSRESPIIIYNVDILSDLNLQSLLKYHSNSKALATLVVRDRETQRYFKFDSAKRMVGWTNTSTGENKIAIPENFELAKKMAFSGIHIVEPSIFQYLPKEDKFSIVRLYLELAGNHLIQGYFDDSDLWMDVGKPLQLEEARKLFA